MEILENYKTALYTSRKRHSKATIKNYLADVRKFVIWAIEQNNGQFKPEEITEQLVKRYFASMAASHAAPSIKRHHSTLKNFFSYLLEQKMLPTHPLPNPESGINNPIDVWRLRDFKSYLYVSRASKLTIKNYLADIYQFVHWFKTVSESTASTPEHLSLKTIEEYKHRLFNQAQFSPVSINRKLSSLRKYINWLQTNGHITRHIILPIPVLMKQEQTFHESPQPGRPVQQEKLPDLRSIQQDTTTNGDSEKPKEEPIYSRFGPVRFFQKSKALLDQTTDILFFVPLAKMIAYCQYLFWKTQGSTIFAPIETFTETTKKTEGVLPIAATMAVKKTIAPIPFAIKNIPKTVYAPLAISIDHFSWFQKLIYHLRYTRPQWYKTYHSYPVAHYLNVAVLIICMTAIGVGFYNELIKKPSTQKAIQAAIPDSPPRLIAFQGTLRDDQNLPITAATPLRFGIYASETATGSAMLWQEVQEVIPDKSGNFTVYLGETKPLKQYFFTNNPTLYLGLTVKAEAEMLPRQQLANVSYAGNSDTLQGMSPITDPSAGTKNVLLALDSSGNLTIGGKASPVFQATGGSFTLSGQTLTLTSNQGSNGNIEIKPDGSGIVDIQKPIQNTSNYGSTPSTQGAVEIQDMLAVLATTSGQSAFQINQNGSGPLISASTSGIARFTLDNSGSGMFAGDLAVNGQTLSTQSQTFHLLDTNVINLMIGRSASGISIGSFAGNTTINHSLTVRGSTTLQGGAIIPAGVNLKVSGGIESDLNPSKNNTFNLGSRTSSWQNAYIGNLFTTPSASVSGFWQRVGTTLSPLGSDYTLALGGKISFGIQTGSGTTIGVCKNTADGISDGTEFRECSGTAGDIAEYYPADADLFPGELVIINPTTNKQMLSKSTEKYQKTLLSVVSTYPVGQFGKPLSSDTIPKSERPTAIALSGKVPVQVSSVNGSIKPGDPITASHIPGVGMKATLPGKIIGYALEGYDQSTSVSQGVRQQEQFRANSLTKFTNDPKDPTTPSVGKILVFINPTWYNPEFDIRANGDLEIAKDLEGKYVVNDTEGNPLETVQVAAKSIIGNIETGAMVAKETTTESLTVTSKNISIGGKTLREYILSILKETQNELLTPTIVSPIAVAERVQTDLITPLSDDSDIAISLKESQVEIRNGASGSAVATIDNEGNASFSGTLRAKKIIADEIEGLPTASSGATYITNNVTNVYNSIPATPSAQPSTNPTPTPLLQTAPQASTEATMESFGNDPTLPTGFANIASLSAALPAGRQGLTSPTFSTEMGHFTGGLMVSGQSLLNDTSIVGQLTVGGNLLIGDGTINTVGSDLEIQPLRQGNLSIMGGLIAIDTDGNLTVGGNANFAKDVTIKGKLSAHIISPIGENDLAITLSDKNAVSVTNASGSSVLSMNDKGDLKASGSGRFKDVAADGFRIIRGVQADTSLTETVADGSAGSAIITAYERERTIISPYVKEDSLIYLTATSNTQGMTPYIARQTAEDAKKKVKGSFTIQLPKELSQDITVNWWIVN
ncbi:MAG: phage integrase N-terminal SAM-like domain-containing protein [Patescibacteria group bacterium]|mgnify:CR=1 FL=1